MSDTPNCPDITRLQALLDGSLPAEAQAGLAAHLETCAHCQRQLELLAGGSAVLPRDPAASARRSPALDQAMQRLKGELADETVTVGGTQPGPLTFHFLSRSENPRHLGRMGGYEILELIGRGGMGIVFKARDMKLERLVAIKVLAPELAASAAARRRFQGEAQKMAAVTHDHVVTIHAVDEADGTPFLVMEYIVGVSLEDRIQRSGHLRVEEILRIGLQAASGLAAAHAQGLVHRDIKPGNILLENGVERVKITDFGLARVIHEAQASSSNVIAGTPQYMSPEQAGGEAVDHRSDLFSLGAVLYAMCVGRSPFRADTPTGAMHRVREDTPRPIREINPDIPEWLVAVIDRLLEKKPEDRFQTATEVAEVLGQCLAHVQQPSRVGLPVGQRMSTKGRHRLSLAARWKTATLLASVAILLLAIAGWLSIDPPSRLTMIDLQPYANNALNHSPDRSQFNLGELRPGLISVGDVSHRVDPRYIQLGGAKVSGFPDAVHGIVINQIVSTVHILHGCTWTHPDHGATVATYTFNYTDGSREIFPIIAGRHLRNWLTSNAEGNLATDAEVAWLGNSMLTPDQRGFIQVFACSWINPHPNKTIASIDFERGSAKLPAPFCLAITCDKDPLPSVTEQGLLAVNIKEVADAGRFSLLIDDCPESPVKGMGFHAVLLSTGRHNLEIRDGATLIRRGTIDVVAGGRIDLEIAQASARFPLPRSQPDPQDELAVQAGGIFALAQSQNGRLLATAAGDGTVVLWALSDATKWQESAVIPASVMHARAATFSPNGRLLATASEDGSLQIWDVSNPSLVKAVATLSAWDASTELSKWFRSDRGVHSVAFSPDGNVLASGNQDGTVELWSVADWQKINSFKAHTHKVHGLAFSSDGRVLATAAWQENVVKIWDPQSPKNPRILRGHTDSVTALAFSPNGDILASVSMDTTVNLWDVSTGILQQSLSTPDALLAVAFSSDGRRLAAGGFFQTVRIWDLPSRNVVHEFQAHWGTIRALDFSRDGNSVITAGNDNTTRVWSANNLPGPIETQPFQVLPKSTVKVQDDWAMGCAFSSSGLLLAATGLGPNLRVGKVTDLCNFTTLKVSEKANVFLLNQSVCFAPNDRALWTCLSGKAGPGICRWSTPQYKRVDFDYPVPNVAGVGFWEARMGLSPDGSLLAVLSSHQEVIFVAAVQTGGRLWMEPSSNGRPISLAISPDGQTLAVGTASGRVILLETRTGKEIREPLIHGEEAVTAVAFSPDGMTLVSGASDTTVIMWGIPSYDSQALPKTHGEEVRSVAWSPNGKLLVTTAGVWPSANKGPWGHQGEVCLWDAATKKLLTKFTAHCGSVTSGIVSPDGKTLATTGRDGKMHLWDVAELLNCEAKKAN